MIKIGTRKSPLALWQANHVRTLLQKVHTDVPIALVEISTQGDLILDKPLRDLGGKGLFLKEIECALLAREIDLAIHSLKDVPFELPPGLRLSACLPRADARDALLLANGKTLGSPIRLGTGSLRRRSQLTARHAHLQFADIRGNVDTRLRKMDRGDFDGLVLAVAGLERLGLAHRITQVLEPDLVIPAAGQGTICVETRADDTENQKLVMPLHDETTALCAQAERSFTRQFGADCSAPVGAFASHEKGRLTLHVCAADEHGHLHKATMQGKSTDAKALGQAAAVKLQCKDHAQ